MNERIKELAEQAGLVTLQHSDEWVELEKFVELIVAECMEVFSKDLPEPGDGKMLEVINRVCNVAEHFGVKNERAN